MYFRYSISYRTCASSRLQNLIMDPSYYCSISICLLYIKLQYILYIPDDNLAYKDPVAQERAIQAVGPFVNEYFPPETLGQILEHYLSSLDQSELHRRGFSLALGNLPKTVLKGHLDKVLSVLIEKTKITKTTEVWAEARRDVIKAIINIIKTMGVSQGHNGNEMGFNIII